MGLRIFTSNRTEKLLDLLAGELEASPPSPLEPLILVVQRQGIERWLSRRLAERLGVFANFRFPFPNEALDSAREAFLGPAPGAGAFGTEILAWRILALLRDPALAAHPDLAAFLAGEGASLKAYQLARRVADAFDQYALFRPGLLQEWELDAGAGSWQGEMWRRLAAGHEEAHRGALNRAFFDALAKAREAPPGLPRRTILFGIPFLPPFHLDAYLGLSRLIDVQFYLLNPCKDFWFTLKTPRDRARMAVRLGKETFKERFYEVGNPLLASLGKQGGEFQFLLLDRGTEADVVDRFEDPLEAPAGGKPPSLLATLQSDVLNNRVPGGSRPRAIPAGDTTLTVHSCHGPMREIEAIQDQLLDLLARDESLSPGDLLIMAPEDAFEKYAPCVESVFTIPVSIADRTPRSENRLAEGFFRLLDLPHSRLAASFVLDLLDLPEVAARLDLSPEEAEGLMQWVRRTRIRWGYDQGAREREGVPGFGQNSWRAGLDRLFLGYALGNGADLEFGGVFPAGPVEGSGAQALGKLAGLVEALRGLDERLRGERPLAAWGDLLAGALEDLFLPVDDSEGDLDALRGECRRLAKVQEQSGFTDPVGLPPVRHFLEKRLAGPASSRLFLTGKATFCALLPMRSVPARVIALVGMNGGVFPRRDAVPSFSHLSRENPAYRRQPGDRSLRAEDRLLFLETVLSARDRLLISYTGQSIRDNSEIQPSVVVSELLDGVEAFFGREIRDGVVVRHRLQGFSHAYFDGCDPRLFSYSVQDGRGAASLLAPVPRRVRFLSRPLPPPGEEMLTVSVSSLSRFFENPCKVFLEQRMGVALRGAEEKGEDAEPIELDALEGWQVGQPLLDLARSGGDPASLLPRLRAEGRLPVGTLGEAAFREKLGEAVTLASRARSAGDTGAPSSIALNDFPLGRFRLTGRVDGLFPTGLFAVRMGLESPRHLLSSWIAHLALLCSGKAPEGSVSRVFFRQPAAPFVLAGPDHPRRVLESLLELYWRGLCEPLPLFPKASRAFAREEYPDKGKKAARDAWKPAFDRDGSGGEGKDPFLRLCFPVDDPAGIEGFAETAWAVWNPLLDAIQRGKGR